MLHTLTGTGLRLERHDIATAGTALATAVREQMQAVLDPVISMIVRYEIALDTCDVFNWLEAQPLSTKLFWSPRNSGTLYAGTGTADVIDDGNSTELYHAFALMRERLAFCDTAHYYGGMRFDSAQEPDALWQSYGRFRFILPRLEMSTTDGVTILAVNGLLHPGADRMAETAAMIEALDTMRLPLPSSMTPFPSFLSRSDIPERDGWTRNINAALDSFAQGTTSKIVLARRATFTFDTAPAPYGMVRRLHEADPHAFVFCFQTGDAPVFLGATPERLYRRIEKTLSTEAVAGTRRRGTTERHDEAVQDELLHSAKDVHEHELVRRRIAEVLQQYGTITHADERAQVMTLPRLHHLHSRYEARLHDTVSDADLLAALHPTPAVGGLPGEEAVRAIAELEQFDRGWYAGPVGCVGRDVAEFAVAIRSGLIEGPRLHLYSGAGIVPGSDARAEWEEIDNKLGNFLTFIDGPRD